MHLELILQRILDKILPHRESPKLAIIKKVYTASGKGKYCADIELLTPGDLEKTGKLLKEVPISPIWAGKNKRGVYATLQKDQIVIVNFIDWNFAFPFIEGVWSNKYDTVEHGEDNFIICSGNEKLFLTVKEKECSITYGKDKKTFLKLDGENNKISGEIENGSKFEINVTKIKLNDLEIDK